MSKVSRRTGSGSGDPTERLQSWTAALATALLHGLLVLLVMLAPPITVTPPQEGGAAGSRLQVTYIDETLRPPSPAPVPPPRPEPARKRPAPTAPASRVQTTPVEQADDTTALQVVDIPATSPEPPDVPEQAPQPPAHTWGQPPAMLPAALAPVNAGPARPA